MDLVKEQFELHLFEAIGIELEYMIVDRETLDVCPIADQLIYDVKGSYENEVDNGVISWSNELVLHVIELKTSRPVPPEPGLYRYFQEQVQLINRLLEKYNAMLMPTAMHPWMDPYREMKLWPHKYNPVFEAFHNIFDCRGHGWANLQSAHINLPFANDDEFERLHAAVRILLPVLAGLSASSPIVNGVRTSYHDYRMEVYRTNAAKVPSIAGLVIPEPVFTRAAYEHDILQEIYDDISLYDPGRILQFEWLNSRGAIARFDRGSIEIRVLDVQECPMADLALIRFITDTLKALTAEAYCSLKEQKGWGEQPLSEILLRVIKEGEHATVEPDYLKLFGISRNKSITVAELWKSIFLKLYAPNDREADPQLRTLAEILDRGTLSSRILQALPGRFEKEDLEVLYGSLCSALDLGGIFLGK